MDNERLAEVYNPAWLKGVSYAGIPALTCVSIWMITRPLWEPGLPPVQYAVGFLLGGAVLYQCIIGWIVLGYLNTRIDLFEDRMILKSNGFERPIFWNELAPPRQYAFATATRLSLKTGETLCYAFDNMRGLHIIKAILRVQAEQDAQGA